MKKIRVGIIGTGGIANAAHIPGYLALKDKGVEIAGLCDINPEALKSTLKKFPMDVPTYSSYAKMLRDKSIDAVSVCTPNNAHLPATVASLKAGKHVLCEKPIARKLAEAKVMAAAAKKYRRKLMIGQNNRWHAAQQAVKRAVDAGYLGDIYYARAQCLRRREVPGWGNFISKEIQGGGPMVDIGVHILDLCLYMMDFPKPVSVSGCAYTKFGNRKGVIGLWGQWDPKKYTVEDFSAGFVRFADGATLTIEASFAANIEKPVFNGWLLGTKGGADIATGKLFTEDAGTIWDRTPYGLKGDVQTHAREIELFIEAIRENKPVPVPAEQACITQSIIDAIYESAETGREVRIK
jgi:predicted dehydrogenase